MTYTIEHRLVSTDSWYRIEPWDHPNLRAAFLEAQEYLFHCGAGEVRILQDGRLVLRTNIAEWNQPFGKPKQ